MNRSPFRGTCLSLFLPQHPRALGGGGRGDGEQGAEKGDDDVGRASSHEDPLGGVGIAPLNSRCHAVNSSPTPPAYRTHTSVNGGTVASKAPAEIAPMMVFRHAEGG